MADQTIPADKVREILAKRDLWAIDMITEIEALLPPPPRPTLADMTDEERAACRWMQADVANRSVQHVIANPLDEDGEVALIYPDGEIGWVSPDRVTPRPDLPRLEWPGDQKAAPAPALPDGWRLADHKEYGRVIVTRPEPDRDGELVITRPHPHRMTRTDTDWCDPGELTYIDQEADQ